MLIQSFALAILRYYTNGRTAKLQDFTSIEMLDHFIEEAKTASEMVNKYQQGTELWLGETSSCYGGGAPDLSDTYVAGFMYEDKNTNSNYVLVKAFINFIRWLDKLGLAAIVNHTLVLRQDYVGGSYALLDSSANPLPVSMGVCVCVCARARMRACVHARVCVHVNVWCR